MSKQASLFNFMARNEKDTANTMNSTDVSVPVKTRNSKKKKPTQLQLQTNTDENRTPNIIATEPISLSPEPNDFAFAKASTLIENKIEPIVKTNLNSLNMQELLDLYTSYIQKSNKSSCSNVPSFDESSDSGFSNLSSTSYKTATITSGAYTNSNPWSSSIENLYDTNQYDTTSAILPFNITDTSLFKSNDSP